MILNRTSYLGDSAQSYPSELDERLRNLKEENSNLKNQAMVVLHDLRRMKEQLAVSLTEDPIKSDIEKAENKLLGILSEFGKKFSVNELKYEREKSEFIKRNSGEGAKLSDTTALKNRKILEEIVKENSNLKEIIATLLGEINILKDRSLSQININQAKQLIRQSSTAVPKAREYDRKFQDRDVMDSVTPVMDKDLTRSGRIPRENSSDKKPHERVPSNSNRWVREEEKMLLLKQKEAELEDWRKKFLHQESPIKSNNVVTSFTQAPFENSRQTIYKQLVEKEKEIHELKAGFIINVVNIAFYPEG